MESVLVMETAAVLGQPAILEQVDGHSITHDHTHRDQVSNLTRMIDICHNHLHVSLYVTSCADINNLLPYVSLLEPSCRPGPPSVRGMTLKVEMGHLNILSLIFLVLTPILRSGINVI